MFQKLLEFFGYSTNEMRKLREYELLYEYIQHCADVNSLFSCRKKIREFAREWGDTMMTKKLRSKFNSQVRLVMETRSRRNQNGDVTEETR